MNTKNKQKKKKFVKPSIALNIFNNEFTIFISDMVIDKFGGSYQTSNELKNKWRKEFKASKEIADFLILQTRQFIRLLNDPNSKNPQFLFSLTKHISDYLSAYFKRLDKKVLAELFCINEPVNKTNMTAELHKKFYDNFSYVINIINNTKENHNRQERKKYQQNNPAMKTKLVKVKPKKSDALNEFNSINFEKQKAFLVCKVRLH